MRPFPVLFLALPFVPSLAVADIFPTSAVPTAAIVYPQGAQVTESFSLDLPAGQHQIVLAVQDGSFMPEIALTGDMTLIGRRFDGRVTDPEQYYSDAQTQAFAALETAQKARRDHQAEITAARETIAALDAQIAYLKSANAAGDVPATPDALQATLNILGQELPRLLRARLDAERAVEELIAAEDAFRIAESQANANFDALNAPEEGWARLVLDIVAAAPTAAAGDLTILTPEASWSPLYDLALNTSTGRVEIQRKAEVRKSSFGDWQDVALTLSTIVPSDAIGASGVFPDIVRMFDGKVAPMPRAAIRLSDESAVFAQDAPMMEPAVVMEAAVGGYEGAAFVFAFDTTQTISGGGGVAELALNAATFDATQEIVAIPRRDETAFVTARLDNTSGGPLIAGPARVYRDGTFFGETFLQEIPDGAEAVLPFGSFETIRLSYRVAERDEGDRGIIRRSNTQNEQITFEIENLGDTPVDLRALYALPISEQEDLKIDVAANPNPDETDANGMRGIAAWDMTVPAGTTRSVNIEMSLTWPEEQIVNWRP